MALLETWRNLAYNTEADPQAAENFWNAYFTEEQRIYKEILGNPDVVVKGTVKDLAAKFGVEVLLMTGFLDGINDSLVTPNSIETMEEDTEVSLEYDREKLYYNMVGCKASWLYELPEWDNLLSEEVRKDLYKKQKASGTYVREGKKIGRNDPCPCGSGKKYKQCCGR
ncbi:SEC-C metal-binding domain-containing protein [Lachnospira multipara]|uniref:SEC-C metal-binding domain-containing protein n=1 Tax=Lachnospira multipara TaxID=28051 RepID=UPI0004809CA3|nr:SEC-C metal-binding domain-containing protein [Lachnospira multipara]